MLNLFLILLLPVSSDGILGYDYNKHRIQTRSISNNEREKKFRSSNNIVTRKAQTNEVVEKEIRTSFNGIEASYGNMFDILPLRNMTIFSLDIHTDKEVQVEIYTRAGSFSDEITTSNGWTLIASTNIVGLGNGIPTPIPQEEFTPVKLTSRKMQAFYITSKSPDLKYLFIEDKSGVDIYTENPDIQVLVGIGMAEYGFGDWYIESRLWNGNIHYSVDREISDTLVTTYKAGETSYGNMFDILSYNDELVITSMDLNLNSTGRNIVEVWSKEVSEETENQYTADNMELLFKQEVQSFGPNTPTPLDAAHFSPISIKLGNKRRFIVISEAPIMLYTSFDGEEEIGEIITSTDDAAVTLGSALLEYPYKNQMKSNIYWNGILRYTTNKLDNTCPAAKMLAGTQNAEEQTYEGFMFNIETLAQPITVQSLDLALLSTATSVDYTIWTQSGTYQEQANSWQEISKGTISSSTSFINPLDFKAVSLAANSIQAFFIQVSMLKLSFSNITDISFKDEYVQITRGQPVDAEYNIGETYMSLVGNGIYYYVVKDCGYSSSTSTLNPDSSSGSNSENESTTNTSESNNNESFTNSTSTDSSGSGQSLTLLPTDPNDSASNQNSTQNESTNSTSNTENNENPNSLNTTSSNFTDSTKSNPGSSNPSTNSSQPPDPASSANTNSSGTNDAEETHGVSNPNEQEQTDPILNSTTSTPSTNDNDRSHTELPVTLPPTTANWIDLNDKVEEQEEEVTHGLDSTTPTLSKMLESIAPTASPSSPSPTQFILPADKLKTIAKYSFNIEHATSDTESSLLETIDSKINELLNELLQDSSSELNDLSIMYGLKVLHVASSVEGMFRFTRCTLENEDNVCSSFTTEVITYHDEIISSGFIRYFLYKNADILVPSLPFPNVSYTGTQALSTVKTVAFFGEDLSTMSPEDLSFYETKVMEFLNEQQLQSEVNVTGVTTDSDKVNLIIPKRRRSKRNRLRSLQERERVFSEEDQSSNNGEFEIMTAVVGEYNPPPEINFDELVQDSYESNGEKLIEKLRQSEKFKSIDRIEAVSDGAADSGINNEETIEENSENEPEQESIQNNDNYYDDDYIKDDGNDMLSTKAIVIYAICGLLLLVSLIVVIYIVRKFRSKEELVIWDVNGNAKVYNPEDMQRSRQSSIHSGTGGVSRSTSFYSLRPGEAPPSTSNARYYYGSSGVSY